jgi:uncharacterized protein YdaU (DUF1376 family)
MFHYQFHVRDYLTKTRHLSHIEDLAYRRLLDTYYTEEGPLPADVQKCARLVAMPEHAEAVGQVLAEFFELLDDGWHNSRCDEEIAKFKGFADAGRRGAAKRWSKGEQTPPVREANGEANSPPTATPIATVNRKPKTSSSSSSAPMDVDRFADFWTAYPRKVAKPEALKAWIKIKPDDETADAIMRGLDAAKQSRDWTKDDGQFIPHPTTWLNQRRWEDQLETAGAGDDHFGGLL